MKVSIVMGSKSDLDLAKAAGEILDTLDVPYSINILSAHRTPELLHAHIDEAIADGCLLYTSPSPRDWMVSRMPSSA